MNWKLGAVAFVAGFLGLAGCATPCQSPPSPEHDCLSIWGAKADRILAALEAQNGEGTPPANHGWAQRLAGPQGVDIRKSLTDLESTVSKALPSNPAKDVAPVPPTAPPTPQQFALIDLAKSLGTALEEARTSGYHDPQDQDNWLSRPVQKNDAVTKLTKLQRAIRDALDM